MLPLITHITRVLHSVIREQLKKITRSSKWAGVRKQAIKDNPRCACCGDTKFLQVHHFLPFNVSPTLELDPKNLVVMCMGKNECHLLIGHGDNFKKYNPYLAADIKNIQSGILSLEDAQKLAKKVAIFCPTDLEN